MFRPKTIFKYLLLISVLLTLIVALSIPYALYRPQSPLVQGVRSDTILIHNINILSDDFKSIRPARSIIINNGVIQDLPLDEVNHNDFALVIDGNNQFLLPGLIDAHTHIYDRTDLLLNLAHGITHVRVMHGLELQLRLRDEVKSGLTIGPDMLVASPAINQHSQYASSKFHQFIDNPAHAKRLIEKYESRGYDLIKIYDGLDSNNFRAINKAAKELKIPIAGHSPFAVTTTELLNSELQSLEHIEMLYQAALNYSRDEQELNLLIEQLKQTPVPISTTLIVYDELAQAAERKSLYVENKPLEYIPPFIRALSEPAIQHIMKDSNPQSWRTKADYLGFMAKKLYNAKLPMLLGSDAGANYTINGFGTIEEMQLLEGYGVSPEDIFTSATQTPAQAFGLDGSGAIVVGYKANLVITQGDPRNDLSEFMALQGLIKDGVYFDEVAIKQMKAKAKDHMSSYQFLGWYLINWWQQNFS